MKIFEEIKKLAVKPMSGMLIVGCYATFLRLPRPNLHLNRHRKIFSSISKGKKSIEAERKRTEQTNFYFLPKSMANKMRGGSELAPRDFKCCEKKGRCDAFE